jgi:sugar phosphate permease
LTAIPSRSGQAPLASGRLHYAWIIAAVTFVVVLLTAGVRAAPGVLIVPLEGEFHWSLTTISIAVSINLLLYGAVGPFAAAIMDRFGVRRTMGLALAAIGIGVALTPAMTEAWHLLFLWGVVVGLGTGFLGWYIAAFVAIRWFHARQGIVMGVLIAANAAGQLVFLPSMAWLITQVGWRPMSFTLAAVVIGFVPILVWLMRDRPENLGLVPYGGTRGNAPAIRAGNPVAVAFRALGEGARSRDFWLLAGSYFVCGASTNGLISTHLIPACIDHGLTEVAGASLLATTGVFAFIGGTASGWLSDRWDNRFLLFGYYGLRGLSLMYLPFALDLSVSGLSLFAVFYGLDWIATGPPTMRLMSGVVGNERTGIMIAWITVIHQVGGALAAYLGGVLRISFGSYLEAFMISGLLCIAAALMVLFIGADRRGAEPIPAPLRAG